MENSNAVENILTHGIVLHFCLVVFFSTTMLAQNATFTLLQYNPCIDTLELSSLWYLEREGKQFFPDSTGTCTLPSLGVYYLGSSKSIPYFITEFKKYTDTVRMRSIEKCLEPITHPKFIGYCCCDRICNGEQVDYYSNGKRRLQGFFNNGVPVGNLNFFDKDENLIKVEKYNKKGNLILVTYYSEQGEILKRERMNRKF